MSCGVKPSNPNSGNDADTPCDKTVQQCQCIFDIMVKLVGNEDERILTPLSIPDYSELGSGKTKNHDDVTFEMNIQKNKVDKVAIKITAGQGTGLKQIYHQVVEPKYHEVGTHKWKWDGFSDAGILDTKILKDPDLKLEVTAELCGVSKTKTIKFNNQPAEQDWVDVEIDRNSKQIKVELRVNIKDGGEEGVGEGAPAEIFNAPMYKQIPTNDPRRQPHQRVRSFSDLKSIMLSGLEKYWSRNSSNQLSISTTGGIYTVDIKPVATSHHAMDDIDIKYNTNHKWGRSSNPGKVHGVYSLFAQVVPEKIVYNVGWIKFEDNLGGWTWDYITPNQEDENFKETSAHEIGHEILSAYSGGEYSYGHKGTSSVVLQEPKPLGDGGLSYPASGEIDLMKYYHGIKPPDFFLRVVASEIDVKSLLWLTRIQFDD